MKNKLLLAFFALTIFIFASCSQDEDPPLTGGNGSGSSLAVNYLKFDMDGQSYNLTTANGIADVTVPFAVDQGAPYAKTGMSFKGTDWPVTDRVFFTILLPIDSTGLSTFSYGQNFLINGSTSSMWIFSHLGSILVQWESGNGNLDGLRENNETDTTTYFNNITNVQYLGNHHYDTGENLYKCDYRITGTFEMRLKNENSGTIKVVSNGEYSMVVDVVAQ